MPAFSPMLLSLCLCIVTPFAAANADKWQAYYQHSAQTLAADQAVIDAELTALGLATAGLPASDRRFGFDIAAPASWYQSDEGKALLDSLLSLQTPSGGWSKRTDMSTRRQPGQQFLCQRPGTTTQPAAF